MVDQFVSGINNLMRKHPSDIRLVLRYAPFHQGSDQVVKLLEAAKKQDKYLPVLEMVLAAQPMWADHGKPNLEVAYQAAEKAGLDIQRALIDAKSSEIDALLAQDIQDLTALEVTKTPTFFVNGRGLPSFGPEQLQALTPDKANAFYIAKLGMDIQDTNPDFPALTLANFLLGSSETSRLWMRVREKEGLSYNVRSSLSVSAYEPNASWSVYAIFAPENRKRVESAIAEELDRAVKDGFTESEVKDGINALLNLRKLSLAQDSTLATTWSAYLDRNRTFAWAAEINSKIAALTPAQVHEALRKYLKPAEFSSVAAGDFDKKK